MARVVERQVNKFDRSLLDSVYQGRGDQPFDPVPMLKMVLYQYLSGEQSPSRWTRQARDHDAMKWLGRGYVPSRTAWYNFRDRAAKFIEQVHVHIVQRAVNENLVDPTVGVQDGTSMASCASRHRMVNRATLDKRIETLGAVIEGTATEDVPKWVPPTSSGRVELQERMEIASKTLDERIEANAAKPSDKRKDAGKIVVSLTDPVAPLGRDKLKVFRPLYTIQMMVTTFTYFILSYMCEPSSSDTGTLAPMIDKTKEIVGDGFTEVVADGGYLSILDLMACCKANVRLTAPVDPPSSSPSSQSTDSPQIAREDFAWDASRNCYRCPGGYDLKYLDRGRKQRHGGQTLWESRFRSDPETCKGCPLMASCLKGASSKTIRRLEGQELVDEHRQWMETPEAQELLKLRGQTVELGFADCKSHRRMTRFHGRGEDRATTETGILVVSRNIMILDKLERKSSTTGKQTT